jgi:hypothetical protein
MNDVETTWLELRIALPSNMLEAMLDICPGFVPVDRAKVIGSDDALAQLLHLRTLHHGSKLGLADQKALQKRFVTELIVGEHAQFLDRAPGQILSFVDDEQCALVFHRELAKKGLKRAQ